MTVEVTEPSTAELFLKYRQMVYRTCLRYCKDSATAEDLAQEVFGKLHEKRPTETRSDWAAWLYVLAMNHSLDYIRTQKRRAELVEQWKFHFEGEEADEEGEGREEARLQVESILQEADAETRSILMLHYGEGVPQGQVAGMLKVSRMTINTRIKKFREKLASTRSLLTALLTVCLFVPSDRIGVTHEPY